jgi:hypothetical protein
VWQTRLCDQAVFYWRQLWRFLSKAYSRKAKLMTRTEVIAHSIWPYRSTFKTISRRIWNRSADVVNRLDTGFQCPRVR